jgi:hypothetical protein
MAQEDIVKMARKAGIAKYGLGWTCWEGQLEAFAALVAAEKEKQIIDILERLQERNESHTYYKYAINVIKGEI